MAYSDRELLARLIQCEAGGEGDTGMKAVAGVVMNRVHAQGGEYARVGRGSIRNIIFQPYQFVCASETERGAYNPKNIFNMRPEQIHFDIAVVGLLHAEGVLDHVLWQICSDPRHIAHGHHLSTGQGDVLRSLR